MQSDPGQWTGAQREGKGWARQKLAALDGPLEHQAKGKPQDCDEPHRVSQSETEPREEKWGPEITELTGSSQFGPGGPSLPLGVSVKGCPTGPNESCQVTQWLGEAAGLT